MRLKKNTRAGADTFYINRYFEVDGSGVKTKYYYFGDQRVAMRSQSVLTTLHADHLGSTVAATRSGVHELRTSTKRSAPTAAAATSTPTTGSPARSRTTRGCCTTGPATTTSCWARSSRPTR